jgi:hypothetical protein
MSRRSVQRLVLVHIPTLNGGPDLPANARVSTVTDRTRDPKGRLVRWANPLRQGPWPEGASTCIRSVGAAR